MTAAQRAAARTSNTLSAHHHGGVLCNLAACSKSDRLRPCRCAKYAFMCGCEIGRVGADDSLPMSDTPARHQVTDEAQHCRALGVSHHLVIVGNQQHGVNVLLKVLIPGDDIGVDKGGRSCLQSGLERPGVEHWFESARPSAPWPRAVRKKVRKVPASVLLLMNASAAFNCARAEGISAAKQRCSRSGRCRASLDRQKLTRCAPCWRSVRQQLQPRIETRRCVSVRVRARHRVGRRVFGCTF